MATTLKGLANALRALAEVPSKVSARFAEYVDGQLKEEFASGTDPYGNPWKPNAPSTIKRKGHGRPLIGLTRQLSLTTRAEAMSSKGVSLRTEPDYAIHNQATRPFFPDKGMPAEWRAALKVLLSEEVERGIRK